MKNGDTVIVPTKQAGTIVHISGNECWVLLGNGDFWIGSMGNIRPATKEEAEAAPLEHDRLKK